MSATDWTAIVGQFGASAIFMAGVVVVARAFWQHLEAEIVYQRAQIAALTAQVIDLEKRLDANPATANPKVTYVPLEREP